MTIKKIKNFKNNNMKGHETMNRSGRNGKRILAATLIGAFMVQQMLFTTTMAASTITTTGGSGVTWNGNTATIDALNTAKGGSIGYNKYSDFNLGEGDIANLNFKDGMNTFVNLVDKQININGVVNTVKGNAFHNGRAVFISPNGMVVGGHGVLNVGSLGVYTPTQKMYDNINDDFNGYYDYVTGNNAGGNHLIQIKGKVISAGDVVLSGRKVDITSTGGIVAGIKADQMQKFETEAAANTLFNEIVNTDNMNLSNKFASSQDGHIVIKSAPIYKDATYSELADSTYTGNGGTNIAGKVKNFATGKNSTTEIHNTIGAKDGITISGEVANAKGYLYINSNTGSVNVTDSGVLRNNGVTQIGTKIGGEDTSGAGVNIAGHVYTTGDSSVGKTVVGLDGIDTFKPANGTLQIRNDGQGGLTIGGEVEHAGDMFVYNGHSDLASGLGNEVGAMNISGNVKASGNAIFENTTKGVNGLNVTGTVYTGNDTTYLNNGRDGLNFTNTASSTADGNITMTNYGAKGLNFQDSANIDATKKLTITNHGENGLNAKGSSNLHATGDISMTNTGKDGLNLFGTNNTTSNSNIYINNSGQGGLNVIGRANVEAVKNVEMENTGANGTEIGSSAKVTSTNANIKINDVSAKGITEKGLVTAKNNVDMTSNGGDIVIGDTYYDNKDHYVTAGNDITLTSNNGNILNAGVARILLTAGGDLTMKAINGRIGDEAQQNACTGTGCTGIGPKAEGSRDFTKSINGKITGKVKAETTDTNAAKEQLINYAAIDSDMNIDTINAHGRVILTVDDSGHAFGNAADGKRYNMVNARPDDNTDTNIEGWGMSLISNGSIGNEDNKVTFIQTKAAQGYGMDVLTNENIYLKENSYNDANYAKGGEAPNKEITTNKACTIIAREGDADIEFAGNTTIKNITAEGDLKVVTRGKNITIENLGHIVDSSVTPEDYFGPRNNGLADNPTLPNGGYTGVYEKEPLPNTAVVKALDINKAIRPDGTDMENPEAGEGLFYGKAGSTAKIVNATLDNGTLDIHADTIYANGIKAEFKDNFTKVADNSTNKVNGASEIPTGHAVRPDDVKDIDHNIHERNYYYPTGDGDGIFGGVPSNVDPDDGIAEATPLELPDRPHTPDPVIPDNPIIPDIINNNDPAPRQNPEIDGSITYTKESDNDVEAIDKRQFMRFNVRTSVSPVAMERTNNGIDQLLDVSRGGIAVTHDNKLKVGDVIPVHLTYGDVDIKADVKVVTATTTRAGAEFVNLDKATANQLLYLNLLLNKVNKITYNK